MVARALAETSKQTTAKNSSDKTAPQLLGISQIWSLHWHYFHIAGTPKQQIIVWKTLLAGRVSGPWYSIPAVCPGSEHKIVVFPKSAHKEGEIW